VNCDEARVLVDGYMDGELDLVRALEFEAHLHDCRACSRLCDDRRALATALRDGGLRFGPPPGLERRVVSRLRGGPPTRFLWLRRFALAASLLLAFGAGALLVGPFRSRTEPAPADEVVAAHVRSLMLDRHLLDFPSNNQHEIKPFFRGKIEFAPWVKNLEAQGFPLIGARLDYLDRHKAAALVFKRHDHVINLFTWPTTDADRELQALRGEGYHLLHWTQDGMQWWTVSDLNADEMREFVGHVRESVAR
jgi:anti-sigma factor RsiW